MRGNGLRRENGVGGEGGKGDRGRCCLIPEETESLVASDGNLNHILLRCQFKEKRHGREKEGRGRIYGFYSFYKGLC